MQFSCLTPRGPLLGFIHSWPEEAKKKNRARPKNFCRGPSILSTALQEFSYISSLYVFDLLRYPHLQFPPYLIWISRNFPEILSCTLEVNRFQRLNLRFDRNLLVKLNQEWNRPFWWEKKFILGNHKTITQYQRKITIEIQSYMFRAHYFVICNPILFETFPGFPGHTLLSGFSVWTFSWKFQVNKETKAYFQLTIFITYIQLHFSSYVRNRNWLLNYLFLLFSFHVPTLIQIFFLSSYFKRKCQDL